MARTDDAASQGVRMVLELRPSADIHLARIAPYNTVTLTAWVHDTARATPVPAGPLRFEMDRIEPEDGFLDDGNIRIEVATGVVTARSAGDASFVRVLCDHPDPNRAGVFTVPVRICVYDDFPTVWIGNATGRIVPGTDAFVPTIFAESSDQIAVDITGHGFVRLALDAAVPGCSVDPVTGRVTAAAGAAGRTLLVNVEKLDGTAVGQLPVAVAPTENPIVDELPFEPGEGTVRRNILLVAEGFAQEDEPEFRRFALRVARRMRKRRVHEPFRMLRRDYRLWTAFAPSAQSGITITTRVHHETGELLSYSSREPHHRLLQVHDTPFGLAYGRRAGDLLFELQPPQAPDPPEGEVTSQEGAGPQVVVTPEEEWRARARESEQMLNDWRRLGSNRARWNEASLAWLAGLCRRPEPGQALVRIGETWSAGGADQGLVLVIGNEEVLAGRYEKGHPDNLNGYLFGTVSLGQETGVTVVPSEQASYRYENVPEKILGTGDYHPKMVRALVAIHELAHAFFLGDEYEDIHGRRETAQQQVLGYDNVDCDLWIGESAEFKWSFVPRVAKCSTLAQDAAAVDGRVEVVLHSGEGALWSAAATVPVAALQTRNINRSSAHENRFEDYPLFRAHAPRQVPLLFGLVPAPAQSLLRVTAVAGDRVTLEGDLLTAEMVFPAGSMLFAPLPGPGGQPLSLVLPGVLDYLIDTGPLHGKGGNCANVDDRPTVAPSPSPSELGIDPPRTYAQVVGLYEGAGGFNCSVYRPTGECIMRNEFGVDTQFGSRVYYEVHKVPFCHVCRYTIVQEINPSRHVELDALYPGSPLP